jgi:hypothetical protein
MKVPMEPSLSPKHYKVIVAVIIFAVLAVPTIGVGTWYYRSFDTSLTNEVYSHIQTIQELSAKAIALRMDEVVKIAESYTTQPDLQNAMAEGAWDRGITIVKNLQDNPVFYDYYIDRIFLIGTDGKINAAFPGIAAADIGTIDGGYTTWSGSVLTGHETPYVSNVVLRSVSPRMNVIKILIPVVKNSTTIGVLRFDVPIDEFSNLGKEADLSSNGFVYFTDATGQVISHPKVSSDWPIVSFASVPSVDRAIHDQSGTAIMYNPIEQQSRVAAYGKIPGYGWVVVAQEPLDEAFATRDAVMNRILAIIIVALLIEIGIAVAVFAKENTLRKKSQPQT